MKPFQAILFDFDGVIANNASFDKRAMWMFFEKQKLSISPEEYENDGWFTKSWQQILDTLGEKYGFHGKKEEVEKSVFEYEKMLMKEGIEIDNSLIKLLNYCEENHISVAIGSNSQKSRIQWTLDKMNIQKYFLYDKKNPEKGSNIVSADDIIHYKPDPEVWIKCAEMLEVSLHDCLVIEDGLPGLTGAKQCGARGIYYHRFCRPEKACMEIAERSVESFSELFE